MKLVLHMGGCCGIKTIYGLPKFPEDTVPSLMRVTVDSTDQTNRLNATPKTRFYTAACPVETGLQRLDRYIKFLEEERPQGVIEVVVAETTYSWGNQTAWIPKLRRRGFRCVTKAKNSNTNSILHIFHKVTGEQK